MAEMFRWMLFFLLAGVWLPLEATHSRTSKACVNAESICYSHNSSTTCFSKFGLNINHQVHSRAASRSYNLLFPGSTVIFINKNTGNQRTVEIFTANQTQKNNKIITDAQQFSANVDIEWPVFDCRQIESSIGFTDTYPFSIKQEQQNGKHTQDEAPVESDNGQSPSFCVGHIKSDYRYTCRYSGRHSRSRDSSCIQCVCEKEDKDGENKNDAEWCCNCDHSCSIVCHKQDNRSDDTTTKFVTPSTSAGKTEKTVSTSPVGTQDSQNRVSDNQTTKSTGQLTPNQILLIFLVLLVVAFIIVAIILIIRKRKFCGRSELSMTRTNQNEAVSSEYETTVRENHYELSGEGVPIYTELELTQEPAPSNSTVYASVQPTGETVDMGKRVVYSELDKATVAVSPIYSQPFEPEASAINKEYAEPFKPDTTNTATAQVPSQYYNIAAVDQQNAYSLAKAIPLSDPNVIYSQPNKPTK